MDVFEANGVVPLSLSQPVWEQVFTVAPLVLIGTLDPDGSYDLAPKHMVTPMGWDNYFGFVCTPRHQTYHNVIREDVFTVSYPRPTQVVLTTLTATARTPEGAKANMESVHTMQAREVDGIFLRDAYLFLECRLDRVVDGFGENSLIVGQIVAAYASAAALRGQGRADDVVVEEMPLLTYLNWGRFARIEDSFPFPFLQDFKP